MVMHARKLPRLNDGYFERNQPHPYQNTGKYSSKSNFNDRYNDKVRDSPSNGSAYRNESPDGQPSPRDRSYHNKSSYSQRLKERDRDRDRHERDNSRSPKGKTKSNSSSSSSSTSRDHHQSSSTSSSHRGSEGTGSSEHRNNHDRNIAEQDKEKDKEKRVQVGDWSEHISSSGKKYYYNCKTEVSQWEKPKEWTDYERQQGKSIGDPNKTKDRIHEKPAATDRHSNDRTCRSSATSVGVAHHRDSSRSSHDDRHQPTSNAVGKSGVRSYVTPVVNDHGGGLSHQQRSNSMHTGGGGGGSGGAAPYRGENHVGGRLSDRGGGGSGGGIVDRHRHASGDGSSSRRDLERTGSRTEHRKNSQTQDMDISPDSTPTNSQPKLCAQNQGSSSLSSMSSGPTSASGSTVGGMPQPQHHQPGTPVSIASLPKLLSHLTGNKALPTLEKTELSAQEALQTLQSAIFLTRHVSLAQTNMTNQSPHSSINHMETTSPFFNQKSPLPVPMPSHPSSLSSGEAKLRTMGGGNADDDRVIGRTSPCSEYGHRSSRRGSPTSSVGSLHSIAPTGTTSLASASLRPAAPLLTPSLANYFREDLTCHVTGWQADHAERQANRYSEDAHSVGSLSSTKVSAELKMARSLVRVAEIQSTLQEQRILFLQQQIKQLELLKSQNSFMSDS